MIPGSLAYYASTASIGAVVGFASGLFGKGGSAVTTPALRLLLGVPRFAALASPLPAALPSTISASYAYRDSDLVDPTALRMAIGVGLPAILVGSFASSAVGGHFLLLWTALLVLGLGISMLTHQVAVRPPSLEPRATYPGRHAVIALGVGFLAGLLANTGGVLFAPLFIKATRMEPKRALATSLLASAILAVPGTVAHALLGHIDWRLVVPLALGGLPTSYLGARLALRLRTVVLLRIYGAALTVFGLYDLLYTERAFFPRLFGP